MPLDLDQFHTRGVWLRIIYEYALKNNYIDQQSHNNLVDRFGESGISSIRTYTFLDEIYLYEHVVYRHIFERNKTMPFYEVGYENYMAYAGSSVGQTTLVLFKHNWRLFALSCGPVITAMATGFTIQTSSPDDSHVVAKISNCPYDVAYFGGIYNSALQALAENARLYWQALSEHDFQYDFFSGSAHSDEIAKKATLAPSYAPGGIDRT